LEKKVVRVSEVEEELVCDEGRRRKMGGSGTGFIPSLRKSW
jgi:hypothetical protein